MLSRERAKDMASDYTPEIEAPERATGPAIARTPAGLPAQPPENSRGIFASFRPVTQPGERIATPEEVPGQRPDMDRAIRRYASLTQEIERMRERSLPVLPEQRKAWERARSALDAMGRHAARDLESAFAHDPSLLAEAGAGRTRRVILAMESEAQIRTDPKLRADRFVADWQKLERQRMRVKWSDDRQRAQGIRESMGAMADGLKRDPQLESILRNRRIELGLHVSRGQSVARELIDYLGLGRSRGLGR